MSEVVVFGSIIVDFICYSERLPKPGETLHGTKFATGFGGKGANQCVAAARLGASTAMIGKLGDDSWGSDYIKHLCAECVNMDFVEQCKGETTGIAQICVAESGENHIVIVVGANNLLSAEDAKKAQYVLNNAKILICQLETPPEATLAVISNFKGISILNAAPAIAKLQKEFISTPSIFCVNETEAALVIGSKEVNTVEGSKAALSALLQMGAKIVIITLGVNGAVYADKKDPNTFIHVPCPSKKIKVVDTTGAGDAFIGGLAYCILKFPDSPLHQQIGGACEVATLSVQHPGTQASYPKASQVDLDLKKKNYEWKKI